MSSALPSPDVVAAAYRELRSRVVELLRSTPEDRAELIVPACPEWTVRALVSHLVGVPEDIITGNMEGVASPNWTAAQVDRHREQTLLELADSYAMTGTVFDDVLPMVSEPANSQVVMDAVTHEFDLRETLGDDGARDSSAVSVALAWLRFAFARRLPEGTFDALDAGRVSAYDLVRCLTGRRSVESMDELGLDGEGIRLGLAGTPLSPLG